jgi:hypothetical protein
MMINKKGNAYVMILFIALIFIILFLGFAMVVGSSVINWVFDEAVPEVTNLGMVGDANMTEIASYTITPINNIVQSFTWLTGILYMMMVIGSFGLLFIFKATGSKWLIGFYVALMLVLVLGSMFMSNMYEDFYNDTGELGTRLKEHTLLSWMILYSPAVFSVVGFIFGALLFSGIGQQEEVYY